MVSFQGMRPNLFSDDLALYVHGDEVCGEACEVSAGDGLHQSGLTGTVGADLHTQEGITLCNHTHQWPIDTHQSVLASDLDSERSLVEQHSGSWRSNMFRIGRP